MTLDYLFRHSSLLKSASIVLSFRLILLLFVTVLLVSPGAYAGVIENYQFDSPRQQEQFFRLNEELRCPQCQNQSIADSNAPIAKDLRREVHRMIVEEKADDDTIIQFMLDRYGDFVLYKPRMDARTIALWFGPLILLLLGMFILFRILKRHRPGIEDETLDEQDKAELEKILGGKDK
ncbi:cytochrome c-type biogenesis protein [Endozoicomonas sp. 8E]|uniref:cytochrome c-type biogenesis protein n=1 Tax=Endozoicomonas sp. 8E TaxID=3035692 RepID=UPI0029392840|nr:cytochrome c-type biogenesis protein [Endozoicomonas sp. 8E]WOG29677.1 cytochrome c-type biogenesis protein CcmH [Endozoicomonas sp. 8E]